MNTSEEKKSLIEFPLRFPIKVMGLKAEGFVSALVNVAQNFDASFDSQQIELRESRAGKYVGVTLHVWVTQQEQLDELYRTLSTHPMVKVVL